MADVNHNLASSKIIELAETGRGDTLMQDLRARALYSSYFFVKVVLGYNQLVDHFHLEEMERFLTNWEKGHNLQWIEWSRGFFKTTCFTIGTSMWRVLPVKDSDGEYATKVLGIPEDRWRTRTSLHNQDQMQLLAFNSMVNAAKKIAIIKYHFEENELFRALFPEIAYLGSESPWTQHSLKIRRVGHQRSEPEGTFDCIGVGGALESRHYNEVWEDDLVDRAASESRSEMDKIIRWHDLLDGAFVQAADQTRTGVGNRWTFYDLNHYIRENDPSFLFHHRSAVEPDPETGIERATFPERMSIEDLRKIEAKGDKRKHEIAAQYYNSPRLPGDQEVDLTKLHTYHVEEGGKIVCSCGLQTYPTQLWRAMGYDPYNAKGAGSTSCPAIVILGTHPSRHVFILEYFTTKKDYSGIYDKLYSWNDRWRPELFVYEDVAHQNMTEFHIRQVQATAEFQAIHKRFPRIEGKTTGNMKKEARIRENIFPIIERGEFSIRSTHILFRTQLETFPFNAPDHDYDLLDATEDLIPYLQFQPSEEELHDEVSRETELLSKLGKPYCDGVNIGTQVTL